MRRPSISPRALRRLARTGVVALVACVALAATACRDKETPEAKIKKVLDEGVAALEARDASRAADVLSDEYGDKKGRDKQKLKQLAFFALQQGPVLVATQSADIQVDGARATVAMKVLAVQGNAELKTAADLLPSNARAFDLTLTLVKEGSDWKVKAIDGLSGGGWD
jgi:hypothetical protein